MAYGVRTYTCTVPMDTTLYPSGVVFDLSTKDLPVSDYEVKKVKITFRVKMTDIYGEAGWSADAILGKKTGGTFTDIGGANGEEVVNFDTSDEGKSVTYTLESTDWGSGNINNINAVKIIEKDFYPYGDASIHLVLKENVTIKVEITHTGTSACIPPSSVTAPQYIHYHGGLRVQWNAGQAGNKSPVTGYAVYRSATQSGTYTRIAALDENARYYDDYDYNIGDTWYYKVKTLTDDHNYDSALSARTGGTTALQRTTAPTIRTGAAGKVYNPRPRILLTLGTDALEEALTVTAENYRGRAEPMAGTRMVLQRLADLEPGSETVTVTNTDTSNVSYSATATVTVSSVTWTDDPIVAGETRIKAAHIMEMRACLDDICDYYGLSRTDWGGDITSGVTSAGLWPGHMAAIQATARRIAQFINSWDAVTQEFGVTLPFFETVNRANAKAVNQMRQIITIL